MDDRNTTTAACALNAPPFVPARDPLPFPLDALLAAAERRVGGPLEGLRVLAHNPQGQV
jgi:hypothetical protein